MSWRGVWLTGRVDCSCSQFGLAFAAAASSSGARSQQNTFEASVVEVRKDDIDRFLVSLTALPQGCKCRRLT